MSISIYFLLFVYAEISLLKQQVKHITEEKSKVARYVLIERYERGQNAEQAEAKKGPQMNLFCLRNHGIFYLSLFLTISLSWVSCGKSNRDSAASSTLQIFAAAGTRLATEALCDQFESQGDTKVSRNYASSGTLARQIVAGADADVFVSANKQWISFLNDKGLLVPGSVHKIAGNALVMVAPKGKAAATPVFQPDFDIETVVKDKIAIGDPAYVPVGKYTQTAFEKLGWSTKLKDKMVMAKDVTAVLNYVALGAVDWGVVYRSEAIASKRVDIIATIPQTLHSPISFFVTDLKQQQPTARALSEMFRSKVGLAAFLKYGFIETRMAQIGLEK